MLSEKKDVEYRSLPTRSLLNRCDSRRVPFHWTINPYRGCEYGCKYCYARFTHEFLEIHELKAFETEIYAKDWSESEFVRQIRAIRPGQVIGLGTATDPYQPAERKFARTRMILECLAGHLRSASLFITSKSDLVSRDADLLKRISERNEVRVTLTVTSMDLRLTRSVEPFAPRSDLRLKCGAELVRQGIALGVIASPVLPSLTDSTENLEQVARAAKAAGADHFGAHALFLKPSAQRVFFPYLQEEFPQHVKQYERLYGTGAYLRGAYPDLLRVRVDDVRSRVGIQRRDMDRVALPQPPGTQMQLF